MACHQSYVTSHLIIFGYNSVQENRNGENDQLKTIITVCVTNIDTH